MQLLTPGFGLAASRLGDREVCCWRLSWSPVEAAPGQGWEAAALWILPLPTRRSPDLRMGPRRLGIVAHVSEVVWTLRGSGAGGRPGGCEVCLSLLEHTGRSVPKDSTFSDPQVGVEARNATRCVFRHVFPELLSQLVPVSRP